MFVKTATATTGLRPRLGLLMARQDEFLPVFVVANRLGVSVGFLLLARRAGYGPPCRKFGDEILYPCLSGCLT